MPNTVQVNEVGVVSFIMITSGTRDSNGGSNKEIIKEIRNLLIHC